MDVFWGNFLPKPCCLWDIEWGRASSPCSICSPPTNIRKVTCPGEEVVVWGNICNILRNIEYNFVGSFCFTCYEHKVWTYTANHCLPKLIMNLLILKIIFDCCCFTMVRSYKHLIRFRYFDPVPVCFNTLGKWTYFAVFGCVNVCIFRCLINLLSSLFNFNVLTIHR